MYVERFVLHRAPAMQRPIVLEGLRSGLVLLVGPNASGKSTIGRTLGATLWPDNPPPNIIAESSWRLGPGSPLMQASLSYGHANWEGEGVRLPRALRDVWSLTLRGLISAGPDADSGIAGAIRRELDGGYDLTQVGLGEGRTKPLPKLKEPFRVASDTLRDIQGKMEELSDRERRQVEVRQALDEALRAPTELELVKKALKRLQLLDKASDLERALAEYPEALATLPEDAASSARTLVHNAHRDEHDVAARVGALQKASASRMTHEFPVKDPGESRVQRWVEQARELVETEREASRLRAAALKTQSQVDALRSQVWSDPDIVGMPGAVVLEGLGKAVEDLAAARAALDGFFPSASGEEQPLAVAERDRLFKARADLRSWFLLPRVQESGPQSQLPKLQVALLALFGVLGLGAGGLLAVFVSPWLGLVIVGLSAMSAGIGLGLALPRAGSSIETPESKSIQTLEKQYAEEGYPQPESWDRKGVGACIAEIDEQLLAHDRAVAERKRSEDDRAKRERLEHRVEEMEGALAERTAALSLRSDLGGLALTVQAERLLKLADAMVDDREASAAADAADVQRVSQRDELIASLQNLGLSDGVESDSASVLAQAVHTIQARRQRWVEALDAENLAKTELEMARQKLEESRNQRDDYLSRCGVALEQVDTLEALTEQRAAWKKVHDALRDVRGAIGQLEGELSHYLSDSQAALERRQAELEKQSASLEELQSTFSKTEIDIDSVTRGNTVQQALADRHAALDELAEDRNRQMERHIAQGLVDWLNEERSGSDIPQLLERARYWFLRFSRNRYRLVVGANQSFEADDLHTGTRQPLPNLSDGTRVQLLLAARLSFIEFEENPDVPIPLFLDELLSTTYMEWFGEVGRAVLELASEGRQVFYATGDLGEVAAWISLAKENGYAEPQVVTIGMETSEADWQDVATLPGLTVSIPEPGVLDAIQYTARLGHARPALYDRLDEWPLSLLLYDRLPAAHRAAQQGVRTAGQLVLAEMGLSLPISEPDLAVAQARKEVIEACLNAFRIGRGRPLVWDDIIKSDAVNATYIDRVRDRFNEHQGDTNAFMDSLLSIKRFGDRRVKLAEYLESEGVIDRRETLSSAAVVERSQVACRDWIATATVGLADVEQMVLFIAEVLGLGGQDTHDA